MNEFIKQLSGGVLRLYDAQGVILAVGVLPEDVLASISGEEGDPSHKYVLVDFTVTVYRSGLACYGLIQTANGKLTPKLSCGLAGSGALLILPDAYVVAKTVLIIPGITLIEGQDEFNRQLAAILEKVIKPQVSANVQVIRAADKAKANVR